MARISVRNGLIGLGVVAIAGASWVNANQHGTEPAAPAAPAASAAAATASVAAAPGKTLTAGRQAVPKAGAKPVEKPLWTQLTPPQQAALEPLVGEWNKLSAVHKQKWLEIVPRYTSMKPEEQQRMHERMREWIKLTPDQRRLVRENYTRSKKIQPGLQPGQKSAQWEQYQQLPEEQKKKLAADADSKTKRPLAHLPTPSQSKAFKPMTITPIAPMPIPPATAPATAPAAALPAAPAGAPDAAAPAAPANAVPATPANVK
ncbi:DUF3106 domain-containing protein [Janthinobacterium agaricidamnosum]|uniref:Transmembrane protein n=1 Tax=Janthinobacterium agaricidamnosum NBRC 102515 = DSM 9628 TaxID=1349767 RepID=W0V7Y8_9BURK|nr:DUF3106 domain-containing protein [Janthinobacterium agaricidamnosum]CDG83986.1 transmembrane protein [Janthinobacterium agaricidamnosum NBRC 102515 = DSM 9628]